MDLFDQFRGLAGIALLVLIAWALSENRSERPSWRWIAGALIPLTLKRLGADPATASSIFLTTMSDVASMGVFLGLATLLL